MMNQRQGYDLSEEEIERYSRQILLSAVGGEGQRRLIGSQVVVIGSNEVALALVRALAAAGVGQVQLMVDQDGFDGQAWLAAVRANNPAVVIETLFYGQDGATCSSLICVTDLASSFLQDKKKVATWQSCFIAAVCGPWGAIWHGDVAQLLVQMEAIQCLWQQVPKGFPGCEPLTSLVVGTAMATEIIKTILGFSLPAIKQPLLFDALQSHYRPWPGVV